MCRQRKLRQFSAVIWNRDSPLWPPSRSLRARSATRNADFSKALLHKKSTDSITAGMLLKLIQVETLKAYKTVINGAHVRAQSGQEHFFFSFCRGHRLMLCHVAVPEKTWQSCNDVKYSAKLLHRPRSSSKLSYFIILGSPDLCFYPSSTHIRGW